MVWKARDHAMNPDGAKRACHSLPAMVWKLKTKGFLRSPSFAAPGEAAL